MTDVGMTKIHAGHCNPSSQDCSWENFQHNHHSAEVSVILLVEQSAI